MKTPITAKTSEQKRLEQEKIKEFLSTIPSLEVLDFIEPTVIRRGFEKYEIGKLSRRSNEPTEDQVLEWVLGIVKQENIQGRFLMSVWLLAKLVFGISWPVPWVEVELSSDYEWVKPLWNLHQNLHLMSPDLMKYYDIRKDEFEFAAEAGTR